MFSRAQPRLFFKASIPRPATSLSRSSGMTARSHSENNPWLQGGSGCDNAVVSSNNYLSSTEYITTYGQSKAFYESLLPVINSTFDADDASFKNAYSIFDYINVATIHNQTIPSSDILTRETLRELKLLADVHEWGLAYNSTDQVTPLAARLFGTYTFISAIVRIYASYNLHLAPVYNIAIWTYIVALFHFSSEWAVFRTAYLGPPILFPFFFATVGIIWMTSQYSFYVTA
ncbi:hypothetical protein NUW58_g10679 [Xylaria curta]|uniref:Uncharacterized protein n=1 Tax=Xylaria curta TaxID=42375 RepID=A0ACC1MHE2_9PEZI|nr:hypothetical protein NUW58_g10679 [Xylaria curta]